MLILPALCARGATWYVALSGSGAGGQTWAAAYTSIQAAVNSAASGDLILVKTGHYTYAASTLISNKALTIRGGYRGIAPEPGPDTNDAALTVHDAASGYNSQRRAFQFLNCSSGRLERITIRGGSTPYNTLGGAGVFMQASTNDLRDCILEFNITYGGRGTGFCLDGGQARLERCLLRMTGAGNYSSSGGGLYVNAGSLTASFCEIYGNQSYNAGGGGVFVNGGVARFSSCLIRDNEEILTANAGGIQVAGGTGIFENCTIMANSPIGVKRTGGLAVLTNCIVWNNGDDVDGTVALFYSDIEDGDNLGANGCISADPRFAGGYRLDDGSPCVDAGGGTAAGLGLSNAFSQVAVPDSGVVDMGFHYVSAMNAVDLYVATNGNNANPGTLAQPYRNISYALSVAPRDARIHIEAGQYTVAGGEAFPLNIVRDGVQLLGTNAALTIIDARNANQKVMNVFGAGQGCLVSNLTLRCAGVGGNIPYSGDTANGAGIFLKGSSARVADCIIASNRLYGGAGGGIFSDGGSPLIRRCLLRANMGSSAYNNPGAGLYHANGSLSVIECVIISHYTGGNGQGAGVYAGSPIGWMRLANCVIASNDADVGRADGIFAPTGTLDVSFCTIADNGGIGIYTVAGAAVSVRNSILWNNGDDLLGDAALHYCDVEDGDNSGNNGCISVAPLFVDRTYYHLKSMRGAYHGGFFGGGYWARSDSFSPLIDAADPSEPWQAEPAPNGGRANMGAYGNTAAADLSFGPKGTVGLVW